LPRRLWDEFKQQKKDFDVYMDEERKVRDAQRKIRDEEYQKKLYVFVETPWFKKICLSILKTGPPISSHIMPWLLAHPLSLFFCHQRGGGA
jgi:hypothetical protein